MLLIFRLGYDRLSARADCALLQTIRTLFHPSAGVCIMHTVRIIRSHDLVLELMQGRIRHPD